MTHYIQQYVNQVVIQQKGNSQVEKSTATYIQIKITFFTDTVYILKSNAIFKLWFIIWYRPWNYSHRINTESISPYPLSWHQPAKL